MAVVDLTTVPWNRLVKLAPPGTNAEQLQEAGDRYASNNDVYAAAADLYEEAANRIDLTPSTVSATPVIQSVSQDGISVQYAAGASSDNQPQRVATYSAYMNRARYYRKKSKPTSVLVAPEDIYNPDIDIDDEIIIGIV